MSEEWGAPGGAGGADSKPFDRNALAASLADALKDVSAYGEEEVAPAAPAPTPGPARVPNPFGRPNTPVGSVAAATPGSLPSTPSAAPRTGPSILSGGISAGLSGGGGLGGSTVSAFRSPEGGGMGLGAPLGATGLTPRPLGPLGGGSAHEPPEPAATITLKRNQRAPEGDSPPSAVTPAAPAPTPTPSRPVMPMAGWTAADDDILPNPGTGRRRARRAKPGKEAKAGKTSKAVDGARTVEAEAKTVPGDAKRKRFRLR